MVIVIRHATPQIEYGRCGYDEAVNRLDKYNTTKEIDYNEISCFISYIKEYELFLTHFRVFSSDMPRSISTTKFLVNYLKSEFIITPMIREFDLKIVKLPGKIKLRTNNWFVISRCLWMIRKFNGMENFWTARNRVNIFYDKYINKLLHHNNFIIVSHGLFNHFLKNKLKKFGMKNI